MIASGTNSNSPVRGRIVSGNYDVSGTNATTNAKRITGTLTNATISNARTTTSTDTKGTVDPSDDVTTTIVDYGDLTAGTFTSPTVFGNVTNGTLTNANITNTTHYFASGTVGARGTLNWKEAK